MLLRVQTRLKIAFDPDGTMKRSGVMFSVGAKSDILRLVLLQHIIFPMV